MSKEIPVVNQDFVATVDDEDYEYLSQFKWYAHRLPHATYVSRYVGGIPGKYRVLAMHREIMEDPKGAQVDHINRNTLDNRRSNLRIVTPQQNVLNRGMQRNNKSGFRGVHWDKQRGKWFAQITINGKGYNLGRFAKKEEAALAYNAAAREAHGDFAQLNEVFL